jgi:hypothetical protein
MAKGSTYTSDTSPALTDRLLGTTTAGPSTKNFPVLNVLQALVGNNVLEPLVQTYTNSGSAGGTFNYINLGGIKFLWGTTATQTIGGTAPTVAVVNVTLPSSFFTTIQTVLPTVFANNYSLAYATVSTDTVTTSSIGLAFAITVGATGTFKSNLLIIGT